MSENMTKIIAAIATILSLLANASVMGTDRKLETTTDLTAEAWSRLLTAERRTNAHSIGRKARFERIEHELTRLRTLVEKHGSDR